VRFLIVDDTADSREVVRELLKLRGHEVVAEVRDGRGAIEATERFDPDAVLLDVRLGAESGFDVARSLTGRWPELAILLMSVDSDTSPERARACGARGFVAKQRLHAVDFQVLLEDQPSD